MASGKQAKCTLVGPIESVGNGPLQIWSVEHAGYCALEYFLESTGTVYEPVSRADSVDVASRDNEADQSRRSFERVILGTDLPYTSRVIVYRPRNADAFSGSAYLEIVHPVKGGTTPVWASLSAYFMSRGDAVVIIQHPLTFAGLRAADPARYGCLHAADPTLLWSMVETVGERMKTGGSSSLLAGLTVRNTVLMGYSFSGTAVATFANYHHGESRLPDGKPIFDGYASMGNAMFVRPLDVPVIRVNSNSDFNAVGALRNRSPDSDHRNARHRLYEIVGASHVLTPRHRPDGAKPPAKVNIAEAPMLPSFSPANDYPKFPPGSRPNDFPMRLVQAASISNLVSWIRDGVPPPRAPRIDTAEDGQPVLDNYGNATGGLRISPVSVPIARYGMGTGKNFLYGYVLPFDASVKQQLYGSHAEYVKRVEASAIRSVADRFLLLEGAEELIRWAEESERF